MKVLITGAFGYFGAALALRLSPEHEVLAVGRPPRSGPADRIRALFRELWIRSAEADVHALPADWMRQAKAIVHLAGGGAAGGQSADAAADLLDNIGAVACVAQQAPPGARLLLASSIYVYGRNCELCPFRETDTLAPDTLYGQMKAVAEALWRQRGGTALRFAHIYGAGAGIDFGRDGVTERLARAAAWGAPFTLQGDGSQRVDLVHIDDACDAVARALLADGGLRAFGVSLDAESVVNIGGGAPVMIRDLAQAFGVDALGEFGAGAAPVPQPAPAHDLMPAMYADDNNETRVFRQRLWQEYQRQEEAQRQRERNKCRRDLRALDITLAQKVLGWSPRVTLAEGAQGLIEMIRGGDAAARSDVT